MVIASPTYSVAVANTASTVTTAKPTGTVAPNLLRVILESSVARTWTIPAGWALVPGTTAGTLSVALQRIVDASDASVTDYSFSVTGGTANLRAFMVLTTGAHPTAPFDVCSFLQSAAGSSVAIPGVTVGSAASVLDSMAFRNGSAAALTKPASMTQDFQDLTTQAAHLAHETAAAGATGTRTWTWTGTSVTAGLLCALIPAPLTGTPSDTLTLTDAAARKPGKTAADAVTLTDAVGRLLGKPLADTVTLADSPAKKVTPAARADSVTVTDGLRIQLGKSLADTVALADSPSVKDILARADTLTFSDSPSKVVTRAAADALSLAEALSVSLAKGIAGEVVSLGDSVHLSVTKHPADAVTFTDEITRTPGIRQADSITLSDSTSRALAAHVDDTLSLTDHITLPDVPLIIPISDTLSLGDELRLSLSATLGDILSLGDNTSRRLTLYLQDALALGDSPSRAIALSDLADGLLLTDARTAAIKIHLGDTVNFADLTAVVRILGLSLHDTLALSDQLHNSAERDITFTVALDQPAWSVTLDQPAWSVTLDQPAWSVTLEDV